MCPAEHWHSYYGDFLAYVLPDNFAGGVYPPSVVEPEAQRMICGHGRADQLMRTAETVPYVTWKNWEKQVRCESESRCGMFTE
jgi:hypothetical protein